MNKDGDWRRASLLGKSKKSTVNEICNKSPIKLNKDISLEKIRKIFKILIFSQSVKINSQLEFQVSTSLLSTWCQDKCAYIFQDMHATFGCFITKY